MLPFVDTLKDGYIIRTFAADTNKQYLVWHRDHKDRYIECEHETDWKFQFDNDLPLDLSNRKLFIPKDTYHRLIKGTNKLTVKIKEIG